MQIAECKYTVTLTAGDPGSDGHGQEIRESYVVNRSQANYKTLLIRLVRNGRLLLE